jgi:flagellar biosynthetic protein FlhB
VAEEQNLERTEEPTPRRRREARRQGQIATSVDIGTTANLLAVTLALLWVGQSAVGQAQRTVAYLWSPRSDLTLGGAVDLLETALRAGGVVMLPVMLAALVAGILSGVAQTRGTLTMPRAKPKLNKISPATNWKRVFKRDAPIELAKTILKIAIAIGAIWFAVAGNLEDYLGLPHLQVYTIGGFQLGMLLRALLAGALVLSLVAAMDYAWQHYQTEKKLKMTRSEVKDEMKQNQGDPQVRSRLAGLMFERSMRRMMQEVPGADVVVTNPEHISVALQYNRGSMTAPRVVAKGAGFVALRIREIAREAGVPIVENRPVARALFRSAKVGQEIPERLFQVVAEVLAYVYRLDRGRSRAW